MFGCHRRYASFTMETILSAAFGRVIELQKGQSNQLTEAATALMASTHEHKVTSPVFMAMLLSVLSITLTSTFVIPLMHLRSGNMPWLLPVIRQIVKRGPQQKALEVLSSTSIGVIEERKKDRSKVNMPSALFLDYNYRFCSIMIFFS